MARAVALEMQEGLSARFLGSQVYRYARARYGQKHMSES